MQARYGHKIGDDGGTFEAALRAVRTWGGVLEHPAYSLAWARYGLPLPSSGGWQRGLCGGWATHVEQWHYGHQAKKATWLYAYGMVPPPMRWGRTPDAATTAYVTDGKGDGERRRRRAGELLALVSWCGNHVASGEVRPRLGKRAAAATPVEFRDALLAITRRVYDRLA